MSLLGNILWIITGSFINTIIYYLGGLVLCLTIIGIPFGVQSFKFGTAILAPFGKDVVESDDANSPLRIIFNILWMLLFGWEMAVVHAAAALACAVTIVGIPFAWQHLKLVPLALIPFGRDLR